jgi:6-phosphogluconolactonase
LIANEDRLGIHIFDDKNEMADFMLTKWKELASESIREKGTFAAALSGGNTPCYFYLKLSEFRENSIWSKTHLFLVDERFVPLNDKESNYGMLSNLLLSKVNIPSENCHPIPVQEPSPEISAKKYEEQIRAFLKLEKERFPVFDLIMLGIGEDGHTASLFPGTEALKDRMRLASPVFLNEVRHHRITLTLPVINNSRNLVFLATGRNKAEVIRRVIKEKDVSLPAAMIKPIKGRLSFLLDREAGSCL